MTNQPLNQSEKCATVEKQQEDHVLVPKKDLLVEHDMLIARVHQLRRLLGYPQLLTGHQRREIAHK